MLFQYKEAVFIVVSVGLFWLSRSSLRDRRSHGFYRFFAWELILAQALLRTDNWFDDPFSIHQLISWLLLTICTYWFIHGVHSLRRMGKPSSEREDSSLIGIEKTTVLVTGGAFRYVRHPIYSSLLFLTWGIFFKQPSLPGIVLAMVASYFLVMTARMEEAENIRFFGAAYQDYMKRTRMFIPFLF
ncbi:MAG: isoprenylcysteine carboxylmethyltransferase family protein [candidate division Zixibacteria bacterium]|nr:isoprenylcysteine carboxylmethyltransferase family protein [candidate division Zixibacteria bacterium]MDH3938772.1 isoprenylcysteine carboxylmethyltransferase family protein [candidate division Zixibacteria bacterium]MDH4034008.1 isoprenylcysteine carboxylmethyltransferase family protein [candidate division Zixibacteria bacterium]